jgi:hypothetical protein
MITYRMIWLSVYHLQIQMTSVLEAPSFIFNTLHISDRYAFIQLPDSRYLIYLMIMLFINAQFFHPGIKRRHINI